MPMTSARERLVHKQLPGLMICGNEFFGYVSIHMIYEMIYEILTCKSKCGCIYLEIFDVLLKCCRLYLHFFIEMQIIYTYTDTTMFVYTNI